MVCVTIRGQRCEITTEISAKGQSRTVLRRRFHGEKRKTGGVALPGSKRTADHILAAVTDVDEIDVGKLYGMCTEDVRRTNGIIDFRNAYKYQKED